MSEGLGSQAYIATHKDELPHIKTSICFCSAGNDQQKTKATLILSRNPDSVPSFLNDYLQGVMDRVPKDKYWAGKHQPDISSVAFDQVPYTPWSDNSTWAAFGVPSVLVMSWPDIYFHSQLLTADTTDPKVMHRAGVTTAVAAYEIADAGVQEAELIAAEVLAQGQFRISSTVNEAKRRILSSLQQPGGVEDPRKIAERTITELRYFTQRDAQSLDSTLGLAGGEQVATLKAKLEEAKQHSQQLTETSIASLNALISSSSERS